LADKSSQLVVDALRRAAADPAGVPLFGNKTAPGLFSGTAMAKQAAQRCKEDDLLRVIKSTARGKAVHEVVAITPKGIDHLLAATNPRQILEDFTRALESRDGQIAEWIAAARQCRANLEGLKATVATVLDRVDSPTDANCAATVLAYLKDYGARTTTEDCPLPLLYKQVRQLSIGQFHDLLRRLSAEERIYLHPWTGPLCELPEPPLALLVGHEIAYYASCR
jgi:hypothetical protein